MRKALEAMRNYGHLQAEAVMLMFEEEDGVLVIRSELMPDRPEPTRQATELSIGVLYRTLRVLLGNEWRSTSVCFRHGPPKDLSVHRRVFDTRLQFNSNIDGIICRSAILDDPLPNYDAETARYLQKLLDAMGTQPIQSLTDKVRQLISVLLPTGRCSVEVVAQHLGLDRRTLHRHLQKDGQSFSNKSSNTGAPSRSQEPSDITGTKPSMVRDIAEDVRRSAAAVDPRRPQDGVLTGSGKAYGSGLMA